MAEGVTDLTKAEMIVEGDIVEALNIVTCVAKMLVTPPRGFCLNKMAIEFIEKEETTNKEEVPKHGFHNSTQQD